MDFETIVNFVIDELEGGDKITTDAGGRTRWGIAERYNPEAWRDGPPSREQAVEIYRVKYWTANRCDLLRMPIAAILFDTAVNPPPGIFNMGPVKILQASLEVTADGIFGPKTLAAAGSANLYATVIGMLGWRATGYALGDPSNRRGWMNRLFKLAIFVSKEVD